MKPSYQKSSKTTPSGVNVGTWMPAEDARLKEAVAKYGPRWVLVASDVSTRTGDQCAKRWNENLNPELDHGPWSPIEDKLLLHLVNVYGHDWKFMASNFFEKRAPLALKNRNSLLKRRQKRQSQTVASEHQIQHSPSGTRSPTPSTAFTPRYRSYPDFINGVNGSLYNDAPTSGTSSPYSGPRSIMDGDFTLYQSNVGSATDLNDLFGGISSATASPIMECLPALPQHFNTARTSEPTSAPDCAAWQNFIDTNAAFGPTADDYNSFGLDSYNLVSNTVADGGSDSQVEYSVTCPRGNLQSLVSHLVDAAMSGTSTPALTDDNHVMVTLRLQSV